MARAHVIHAAVAVAVAVGVAALADLSSLAAQKESTANARRTVIARAKVWRATDIPSMNLKTGPAGPGSFAPGETVTCDYVDTDLGGSSPKFACRQPDGDVLKVKYGATNGEVYGEIAASRLLWALGFAADRIYPVRVVCRGCPGRIEGERGGNGDRIIAPAVVERAFGRDLIDKWDWDELEQTDRAAGGATQAERDALKLLAVLLQHTDNKPANQRIVCAEVAAHAGDQCPTPMMMISDLGITFGRGHQQPRASLNLKDWAPLPIWTDDRGCVGNLSGSMTGHLKEPVISEDGRRFLADRLMQLSDEQLRDLFGAALVTRRPRAPGSGRSDAPTVDEWVSAFKQKRAQIVDRRCVA